jgi:hypothetical protein
MNKQHHIKELEEAIEHIKKEPAQNWIGKLGKSIKIKKIEMKIQSLKKDK